MNKTILHFFLVFAFASSLFPSSSIDLKESFKGREWEFMQYQLKVAPNDYQLFRNNKKRLSLLLTSSLIFSSIITWFLTHEENTTVRVNLSTISGILGFLGGFVVGKEMDRIILRRNKFKILLEFIKYWPEDKEYIPVCFHDSFEQLHILYTEKGETRGVKQQIQNLKTIIKQALNNRFPKGLYSFTTRTKTATEQNPFMFFNLALLPQPIYNNSAMKTWY